MSGSHRFADRATFEAAALDFYEGRITGDAFLRATDARWRAIGARLFRRWRRKLPAWVEVTDIEQELRRLACEFVRAWNPTRGAIGPYVVWSALHRAQREIHRWRGAKLSGNEGKNPSRAELAFSSLQRGEGDTVDSTEYLLDRVAMAADAAERTEAKERMTAVMRHARDWRDVVVLQSLAAADGSVVGAADLIAGDFTARMQCGVVDRAGAEQLVETTMRRIAAEFDVSAFVVEPPPSGTRVPVCPPDDLFDDVVAAVTAA